MKLSTRGRGTRGEHRGHPGAGSQRCTASLCSVTSERLLGGRCARFVRRSKASRVFLSFPALNPSQGGLLRTHPETQPLPVALPAEALREPRSDGGSRGPILVAYVRLQESEGRAPWAAGSRERMESEAGDHNPAFRNLHNSSAEMKLRKRKPTQHGSAQEKRSRHRGECRAHRTVQGTWLHSMVEMSSGSPDSILAVLC